MPTNALNLPAYTVTAFQENEHDYHIDAVASQAPVACLHCHYGKFDGFGRREQMVKDLPLHGKRVGIYMDEQLPNGAAEVMSIIPPDLLRRYGIGAIKPRRSKTAGRAYLSNGCVH